MHIISRKQTVLLAVLTAATLLLVFTMPLGAQSGFRKPSRRTHNQLDISGSFLKTIYNFEQAFLDTVPQPGPDPLIVSRYREEELIPMIFDAVFSQNVRVFDPNFWGSVPQLIEKSGYKEFDTLNILNYLSAGWDTSLMISSEGEMEEVTEYRKIPYEEISGLLFFESWWLDAKSHRLYKDVFAYLPIREYLASMYEGYDENEIRRRLLFMVIPEWSSGSMKTVKYNPKTFRPVKKDIQYEVMLYNKAYQFYLYREEEYGRISRAEFYEWQYHYFDFYRHFDANRFLEKIITGVLAGDLQASPPGKQGSILQRDEIIDILFHYPGGETEREKPGSEYEEASLQGNGLLPEDYPLTEMNSVIFHEDWYIHPETLQIYKDIRGITVNRTNTRIDNYTGEFLQESVEALFTVWF